VEITTTYLLTISSQQNEAEQTPETTSSGPARSCNSSKCASDALEWLVKKNEFPPILLLRRYLKIAIAMCRERNLLDVPVAAAPELPFSLSAIP
jgi:hypothetical protein